MKNLIYVAELDEFLTQDEYDDYLFYMDSKLDEMIEEAAMQSLEF